MVPIVLDKSFVQGANPRQIEKLCFEYDAVMSDVLFFELMTADEFERASCFQKFPDITNPVTLIPGIGQLMRLEVQHKRPCVPLCKFRFPHRFKINKAFDFEHNITAEQKRALDERNADINRRVADVLGAWQVISNFFPETPELKILKPGSSTADAVVRARKIVAEDADRVRAIYGAIRHAGGTNLAHFPSPNLIDHKWLLFRWTQVYVLAAIEHLTRYGTGPYAGRKDKLINEWMDLDHCIIACLADGLASRDKGLIGKFRTLCPDGLLIT